MSSFLSIGFVFEKNQNIEEIFSEFLSYIITDGELQTISYSIDDEGNEWHKETIKLCSINKIVSLMINNFFGKINVKTIHLFKKVTNIDISIFKFSQGDFGFLIEIDIKQLFEVGNKKELESYSSIIINFCKLCFDKIKYRYAFCDHEANIEYTWDEFNKINKNIYSISVIPQNEKFIVNLADWEIDGLSHRY